MSDVPAGDPASGGDIAAAGEQITDVETTTSVPEAAPERQYVQIEDPDNLYDRVKINGEDVEVPYSELRKGYSRESDYTRKMQEVARQREEAEYGIRIQQAYQANPQATIRFLAEQAGLEWNGPQQRQAEPEPEYVDPVERMVHEERQARLALEQRLNQRDLDTQVDQTIAGLRQQFNASDEDIRDVVAVAMQGNYPVEALPMIYKAMAMDKLTARVQAAQAAQAAKEAENARRTVAKTQASQVVAETIGQGNGLTNRTQLQERPTLRQAMLAAFEELEQS